MQDGSPSASSTTAGSAPRAAAGRRTTVWPVAPVVTAAPEADGRRAAAHVLPRGGVVDLPLQGGRGARRTAGR
ncbi:hypothetical protein [Streptomyces sp. NPDC006384]|uniref:hypothetical protein n=1 Tax=Streptomyces sp. NPDC006384 TaxID=3364745 RepID=UPI00367B76B2